jgi:hypothetical protein
LRAVTLPAQDTWTIEDADGVKTVFSIGFKVYDTSAIEVRLIAADGTETLQSAGSDYTVTGAAGAYSVTFSGAPANGLQVAIRPTLAASQGQAFDDFSKFPAANAEAALDRAYHLIQALRSVLDRAVRMPADENGLVFPAKAQWDGKVAVPQDNGSWLLIETTDIEALAERVAAIDALSATARLAAIDAIKTDFDGDDTIGDAAALVNAGSPGIPFVRGAGDVILATFGTGLALNTTTGEVSLDADLDQVSQLSGTGFLARTGSNTWALRDMTATADRGLTISEPAGVGGDVVFTLAQDIRSSASPQFAGGTFTGDIVVNGVTISLAGAVVGQAVGFPNSASTLEPYTPAGGGDALLAADETVTGSWDFTGGLKKNGVTVGDVRSFDDVADLQAQDRADFSNGEIVHIRGDDSPGDRGGRWMVYSSGETTADDGVVYIDPVGGGAGNGRFIAWEYQKFDELHVAWWGFGNGGSTAAENGTAWREALAFREGENSSGKLIFPQGNYAVEVDTPIDLIDARSMHMVGQGGALKADSGSGTTLRFTGGNAKILLRLYSVLQTRIENIHFQCAATGKRKLVEVGGGDYYASDGTTPADTDLISSYLLAFPGCKFSADTAENEPEEAGLHLWSCLMYDIDRCWFVTMDRGLLLGEYGTFGSDITSVDTGTDTFTINAHGLEDGEVVRFFDGGSATLGGLTDGESYFVISSTTNTFQLSETRGGSAVALSGTLGSGDRLEHPAFRSLAKGTAGQGAVNYTLLDADVVYRKVDTMRFEGGQWVIPTGVASSARACQFEEDPGAELCRNITWENVALANFSSAISVYEPMVSSGIATNLLWTGCDIGPYSIVGQASSDAENWRIDGCNLNLEDSKIGLQIASTCDAGAAFSCSNNLLTDVTAEIDDNRTQPTFPVIAEATLGSAYTFTTDQAIEEVFAETGISITGGWYCLEFGASIRHGSGPPDANIRDILISAAVTTSGNTDLLSISTTNSVTIANEIRQVGGSKITYLDAGTSLKLRMTGRHFGPGTDVGNDLARVQANGGSAATYMRLTKLA